MPQRRTTLRRYRHALLREGGVRGAFELAGYVGDLNTLPLDSGDEVCFVLHETAHTALTGDERMLEQVLQQILGRKVWILASVEDNTLPFE